MSFNFSIVTGLDSREFKSFFKASQGNQCQKQRDAVMQTRFVIFPVANPADLMIRQINMIVNVLKQLELEWEILYHHNSQATPKGI